MIIKNKKTGMLSEVTEEQWAEMVRTKRHLLFKVNKSVDTAKKVSTPKVLEEFIHRKSLKIEKPKEEE